MSEQEPKVTQSKGNRTFLIFAMLALVVVAAISGITILTNDAHPSQYACISIGYHGSTLDLTTPGLIHIAGTQYFISCNDGTDDGDLPSSTLSASCLTITPKEIIPSYPGAAATYYYYISAGTNTVSLMGASASTNSTVIYQPTNAYLQIQCS